MNRLRGLLVATVIAAATTAAASAASPSLHATEAGARFPFRSYVLALPKGATISPASVSVTENGAAVSNVSVTPASAANGKFGVVLVLDASNSMAGRPISAAVAAARAFATHLAATQQLGIVTFNSTVRIPLQLTTARQQIDTVLAQTPKLANGTHIYDAVVEGVHMVEGAGVSSGSIVVLSDGADAGSRITGGEAAAAAKKAHVRIFTVGFRSGVFDPAALKRLSAQTGGSFSAADSPAQLERVYSILGARLSREYLLQYQSLAGPSRDVRVRIAIKGVGEPVVVGYRTPTLPHFSAPPFHTSFSYRLWRSPLAAVAFALICALLIGVAIWSMLRPAPSGLQQRVAEFVSLYTPGGDQKRPAGGLAEVVRVGSERSFVERSSRWRKFAEDLEIAEIAISPAQIVLGTAIVTGLAMFLFAGLFRSNVFGVFGLLVPLFVFNSIKGRLAKKRRLFSNQLPDALQVIASAMRAGHTIVGALAVVSSESPEPTGSEVRRAVADEQLGVPLDTALDRVARRMASREFEQVAVVAGLQREAGGNAAEVLDRVADTVRERIELRQLVRSLTAQGRLSRWILTLLPPGLAGIIALLDPGYLSPLFDKSAGRAILVLAGIMIVVGSLLIKKIVDVKV